MNSAFPRLLVATEFAPNAAGGGPALVRQMLKGWPRENLWWWSCLPERPGIAEIEVQDHLVSRIPEKLYPHARFVQAKTALLHFFWNGRAARDLQRAIAIYAPRRIWVIPHQFSILPTADALAGIQIPYHVSIHDFPDAHCLANNSSRVVRARVKATMHLYQRAASRDAISEEMAVDLQKTTGIGANAVVHAGVEPEEFISIKQGEAPRNDRIRIAYAGTIVARDAFQLFMAALDRIRSRLQKPIELVFFGAHSYSGAPWFSAEWMVERGNLSAHDLHKALRQCNWGFAPMELTDENARYNRYSLPTKIVSYLAAGLPMITLGHKDSTVARLARQYRFGIALEDSDIHKMEQFLLDGLALNNPRDQFKEEILRCARERFDAAPIRGHLSACLGGAPESR